MSDYDVSRSRGDRRSFGRYSRSTVATPEAPPAASMSGTIIFALVAILLAGGSFFGVTMLMKPAPAPAPAMITGPLPELFELAALGNAEDFIWDEADDDACDLAAEKQADADDAFAHRLWLQTTMEVPSGAAGFSQASARISCSTLRKPLRLCDADAKKRYVKDLVNYAERTRGFFKTFNVTKETVPPMFAAAALDVAKERTGLATELLVEPVTEMGVAALEKVVAALAPLVEAGLLSADDFGGFMGMGGPPLILAMIEGPAVRGNACDYIPA